MFVPNQLSNVLRQKYENVCWELDYYALLQVHTLVKSLSTRMLFEAAAVMKGCGQEGTVCCWMVTSIIWFCFFSLLMSRIYRQLVVQVCILDFNPREFSQFSPNFVCNKCANLSRRSLQSWHHNIRAIFKLPLIGGYESLTRTMPSHSWRGYKYPSEKSWLPWDN